MPGNWIRGTPTATSNGWGVKLVWQRTNASVCGLFLSNLQERLAAEGLQTFASLLNSLSKRLEERTRGPYDYIVIDEAQDISPMQLKFAGSVASQGQDNLFFAGDLGQ